MPERARHRRTATTAAQPFWQATWQHTRSTKRTLDLVAKAGSAVALGGLLVVGGTAAIVAAPAKPAPAEHVVTYEIAGHR